MNIFSVLKIACMSNRSLNAKMIFVLAHPSHCYESKFTFAPANLAPSFAKGRRLGEEVMTLVVVTQCMKLD